MTCQYPQHSGENKRVKGRDVVNLQMAQDIQKLFGVNVPIGSGSFFRDFVHTIAMTIYSFCVITNL